MATSKLLKPTNVTISIPEFTDQPDQRVNSNCIDKEADAINSLSEQMANSNIPSSTSDISSLASLKTFLSNKASSISGEQGVIAVGWYNNFQDEDLPDKTYHRGFLHKIDGNNYFTVRTSTNNGKSYVIGNSGGTWKIKSLSEPKKGTIAGNSSITLSSISLPVFVTVGRRSSTTSSATAFVDSWGDVVNITTSSSFTVSFSNNVLTITNNLQANASYMAIY